MMFGGVAEAESANEAFGPEQETAAIATKRKANRSRVYFTMLRLGA